MCSSIAREALKRQKNQHKDTRSYFGINLDGKVTKTICRLRLSDTKKYISILDGKGKEAKTNLSSLDEIYGVAAILKDRAKYLTDENYISNSEEIQPP